MCQILAAFDFDHTVCEENTDIVVQKLLPEDKIPRDVMKLHRSNWCAFREQIFQLLHENGINEDKIKTAICNIPPAPGLDNLLVQLHSLGCEIIIISDSNTLFIDYWLKHQKVDHTVKAVFTNPAEFDENNILRIRNYHNQDWCQISEKNLCKGYILENYINERLNEGKSFKKIVYVGDGKNDLCPLLKLSSNDIAFPRINYSLHKLLNDPKNTNAKLIVAKIVPWKSGSDILDELKSTDNPVV